MANLERKLINFKGFKSSFVVGRKSKSHFKFKATHSQPQVHSLFFNTAAYVDLSKKQLHLHSYSQS